MPLYYSSVLKDHKEKKQPIQAPECRENIWTLFDVNEDRFS